MTNAEKSILATLAYYDILDYPLTGFEIWRHLILAKSFEGESFGTGELFCDLHESANLRGKVFQKYGFYYLAGREEIVEKRLGRKKLADSKWKKLRPVFKVLAVVPFVRGIFVSGSLAMENSRADSDIDVIVVAKYGRIWTVRTFMTLLTFFLGVRRHGDKTKDRICLNHYITDQSLRIPFQSLYTAELYVHLVNVYGEDEKLFERFQKENDWIDRYVVHYAIAEIHSARAQRKNRLLHVLSRVSEFILDGMGGNLLEKMFLKVESSRIQKDPLYRKSGGRVTIDNKQLEFHPDSHEHSIIPEFNRRMEGLGLPEFAGQQDTGLNK